METIQRDNASGSLIALLRFKGDASAKKVAIESCYDRCPRKVCCLFFFFFFCIRVLFDWIANIRIDAHVLRATFVRLLSQCSSLRYSF